MLSHYPLWDVVVIIKMLLLNAYHGLSSPTLLVKLVSAKCHRKIFMISQRIASTISAESIHQPFTLFRKCNMIGIITTSKSYCMDIPALYDELFCSHNSVGIWWTPVYVLFKCQTLWHDKNHWQIYNNVIIELEELDHCTLHWGWHFTDDIFKCIFLNEDIWILLIFHWSMFLRFMLTIVQHRLR